MSTMMKLDNMLNKPLYYRGKTAVIKRWNNRLGEIEMLIDIDGTPKQFTKRNEESLELFLLNFTAMEVVEDDTPVLEKNETSTGLARSQSVSSELYQENRETFTSLSQMLLQDIEKVRTDPAYVSQAKQVCNSVNAIVNMTRLQLSMLKNQ